MANYRIILVDWRDKDHINKVIADNGFPIELVPDADADCLIVTTWIENYNPSNFLEKYWGEDIFRPMRETEQDFRCIYGTDVLYHKTLQRSNYDDIMEKVCVLSKTNWLKADIGHDYDLLLYDNGKEILVSPYHLAAKGNWDKLPEMADIKRIVKESRKNDPRFPND